jgi:hypothetical protein
MVIKIKLICVLKIYENNILFFIFQMLKNIC